MSAVMIVSQEVAEEMAAILEEDEVRRVSYQETEGVSRQIKMTLPYVLTPKDPEVCLAGACC